MIIETINFILYLVLIWILARLAYFLYKNFIRPRRNLKERYGDGSWILVTGATDGIGKEFCKEFSQDKFNIILVARNEDKLKKTSEKLEKKFKIKTHTILFDFSQKTSLQDYEETFGKLPEQFDISILVNNVGTASKGFAKDLTLQKFEEIVNVNILPQTMLTKIFTPSMSKRYKRSAIIDVSSISSLKPFLYNAIYSASKVYSYYLSRALAEEYEKYNIDFMCLMPGWVQTKLSKKKSDNFITITPRQCVRGALKDLGYEKETFGHWLHKCHAFFINTIPNSVFYWVSNVENKNKTY